MRITMADIVAYLRQLGQAGENDEFQGVTYWTDDQLEAIADQAGERGSTRITKKNVVGTIYTLTLPRHILLEGGYTIYRSDGKTVVTAVNTYSQARGEIAFTVGQTDDWYFVEGFFVNAWEALAALWEQKASQRHDYINFKAGNNKMDLSQEYNHCIQMRDLYRNRTIRRFKRPTGRWK